MLFRFVLVNFLLLAGLAGMAQSSDFELWVGVAIEKKLSKEFSVEFEEQLRLDENASSVSIVFSQLGISYRVNKHFSIGASYRYLQRRNKDLSFDSKNRYQVDLNARKKLNKKFTLKARTRIQHAFLYLANTELKEPSRSVLIWRNKGAFDFKPKKGYTFGTSVETYHVLNDIEGIYFEKLRLTQSFEYRINKKMDIEVFYRFEKEFNVRNRQKASILGVFYKLDF